MRRNPAVPLLFTKEGRPIDPTTVVPPPAPSGASSPAKSKSGAVVPLTSTAFDVNHYSAAAIQDHVRNLIGNPSFFSKVDREVAQLKVLSWLVGAVQAIGESLANGDSDNEEQDSDEEMEEDEPQQPQTQSIDEPSSPPTLRPKRKRAALTTARG